MKKNITTLIALALAGASLFSCTSTEIVEDDNVTEAATTEAPAPEKEPIDKDAAVVIENYQQFVELPVDTVVCVETYVQAKQSWWDNKGTFYTQNEDGAYFLYEMPCTELEYSKLTEGTKIKVYGYKAEWSGELELVEAEYEVIADAEPLVAEALDVTALLGTDELAAHQNKKVAFKDMTVSAVEYKNGTAGDDIYVTLANGENTLSACIEVYLTGTETEVYQTVGTLNVGDTVDVEGFLYWYNGANPHLTSVVRTAEAAVEPEVKVMTYEEFAAAELDTEVKVETYVQGKQSWWDNKGTFYTQSADGAYFLYEMPCTEEAYNALVPGTKIIVTGYKAEWSGEVEIIEATFEVVADAEPFVADALDVTALLGTDELVAHQNKKVAFKDMTVSAIEYKNGTAGDDIYVTLVNGENTVSACVEVYLTGTETEVYQTVGTLAAGDIVDVEAFLYWYNGANPHITSIVKK